MMEFLWIGFAFVFGFLVSRLRLPPLVGYLLAGIVLSFTGHNGGTLLKEIAHLGVIFLLFTVGLSIRIRSMFRVDILGIAILHMAVTVAIITPIAMIFGNSLQSALVIGILLGFSSTVLTAKTLERRNELGALYGRAAIGILIVQDLIAIAVIAWSEGAAPSVFTPFLLLLPFLRPLLIRLLSLVQEDELWMMYGLALAAGGAWLFSELGLSGELGALIAGMLLASDERSDQIAKKLWGVREAFLVAFFLDVGLNGFPPFDGLMFASVLTLLLPLKFLLFYGLMILFRYRARTSFLTSLSLTTYSEFALIAGAIAASTGVIAPETLSVFGVIVILSFIINTPLSTIEEKIWRGLQPVLARFEREGRHPEHETLSLGSAQFLIIGMGNAGKAAYDRLKLEQKPVVGMDIDPDRIERNIREGRKVLYGDIQDRDLWENVDLSKIRSIMIAMGNDVVKVNATKTLRETGFDGVIYALTMKESEAERLREAGASSVSIPIREAGERLAELSVSETKDL